MMTDTLHIYTRVSTRIQDTDGTSLDTQKKIGIEKSKELGFSHKIWNEGGASSHHEDLENRPVLMHLLSEVENGSVKHLWVYNNDRLSRNEITQQTIKGPFNMIQSALPYMKARGNGQIINISSTMARSPELQHSFYVTAKNALVGLTRSLALELGQYGIRVNLVSPGPLETDHNAGLPKELMKQLHAETPLHARMATCEEVAGAIMLLTLPEAAMVTGTDLQVSGGQAIF